MATDSIRKRAKEAWIKMTTKINTPKKKDESNIKEDKKLASLGVRG